MKKTVSFLIALLIALLPCAASASTAAHIDVSGLWTAWTAGEESHLYLRDDGSGSLQTGGMSFEITWQRSGGIITLDQGGALVDGVCDETAISLAIGGGNLIFLRDLPEILPLDSDLTGTWIARLPGSDSVLTLNADGAAVLQIGPEPVSLTWTHDGAAVTLFQDGFPIDCTYDGLFISIFLGEGSICFMKSVPETPAQ